MKRFSFLLLIPVLAAGGAVFADGGPASLPVRITWGHQTPRPSSFYIAPRVEGMELSSLQGFDQETPDRAPGDAWTTEAGGGDVDGLSFTLLYPPADATPNGNVHPFWEELARLGDADTARRLRQDPAWRPDPRKLTIQMDPEGTRGFSLTVDQLLNQKSFWIPSLDVFVSAGDPPLSFEQHRRDLAPWEGRRVLDQVHSGPEAGLDQFTSLWEDMGSPSYTHPRQPEPGHIVGLSWDSAIPKFGIDRGAGVWNDYGNPDRFRLAYGFGGVSRGIQSSWKSQELRDGLPVITTTFEEKGLRYEVEQFAYPLNGPPAGRRGDIPMVLMQRLRVGNRQPGLQTVVVPIYHERQFSLDEKPVIKKHTLDNAILIQDDSTGRILLTVEGSGIGRIECSLRPSDPLAKHKPGENWQSFVIELTFPLLGKDNRKFFLKLPSPMTPPQDQETLLALRHAEARLQTLRFWLDYEEQGARFRVPEEAVNNLFRANLWHALRLPRRHGGAEAGVKIDLPYSNFAYDQNGIPWPVNQSVYVDYMIYDLRGYHAIAQEELLAMFRENQEPDGRVRGFADWGVYTPSMLYAVSRNFALSQDRAALESLLPYTLKAMDWCLQEIQRTAGRPDTARGLVWAPLNDGTGEGAWAFTQAYIYAGLDAFGRVLNEIGHPRAAECQAAAAGFRRSVDQAFGAATMRSPLVQLRDHTWSPYVPCEALTPRRLLEQWYAADVDTGATHLLRLEALPSQGVLADALINDHEDNLFLNGWGMANEPVYNPLSTAYLLRDDPQAVIRGFYSFMACGFSHRALEPVEHRWYWGQYFGPPSTDGAWFDIYRHMLIREMADDALFLAQATPRKWLENGKQISVQNAPCYFGKLSFTISSHVDEGRIQADITMPGSRPPRSLFLRLRHPQAKPIQSVTVNGAPWADFNPEKEWIVIPNPDQRQYTVTAHY